MVTSFVPGLHLHRESAVSGHQLEGEVLILFPAVLESRLKEIRVKARGTHSV